MNNNSSIGHDWKDVRNKIFTTEEIAESDLRVALIGELVKARKRHNPKRIGTNEWCKTAYNCKNGKR